MNIKRIVSVALAALLFAGILIMPGHAATAKGCSCGQVLQVWVDGFGQPLFYNEGTEDEQSVGPMLTDRLLSDIPALLKGAAKTALTLDFEPLADGLVQVVDGVLGHLALDENGKSIEPLSCHWIIDPAQDHKTEPEFWFRYDFRMDPFDMAAQLNDFIENLCKQTGHSKIALSSHSEGGVITMTYLKEYGTARLETFILVNSGWQGLGLVGKLFNREFALDGTAITNYITNFDSSGEGTLTKAMQLIEKSGLLKNINYLGIAMKNTLMDMLFEKALIPMFCQMPAVWTFVTDEHYDTAKAIMGDDPKYTQLLANADKYHYGVMLKAESLIKAAKADGVKVAVICSYGPYPIPVIKNSNYQCDSIIDTALESGGATAALIGETLPASNSKYRSPDGIFDAATCILPDNTWFVKNNGHSPTASYDLRQWIISAKKQPTVWQNADFPQYLLRVEGGPTVPLVA